MRSHITRRRGARFATLSAVMIGLVSFSLANATAVPHLALSKSEPHADSAVAVAPKELKLWFSETVHTAMTSVRLKASDSSLVTTGTATQNKAAGSPVVFTVKAAMKPGTYVLSWKTMGSDGHAVDGNFKFSVKAAASQ